MNSPLSHRKNIPFFCHKPTQDFQKDMYERYDPMVVRQSALHLADQWWGSYPMQEVLEFTRHYSPENAPQTILEIGCGVGRWIASLAQKYPQATCWGIDYSYQMLKRANEYWVQGKELTINWSRKGFPEPLTVTGLQLSNLNFGLAKAEELPFEDKSQDLVVNSFLLDRLEQPKKSLAEMYRVLKLGGTLVMVTPLNFAQSKHWETFYPPSKIQEFLIQLGFQLVYWTEELIITEPLDAHGNALTWKCVGVVACKRT